MCHTELNMAKKVLLIDDDQGITHLLSRALNRAGFEVMTANDGREGVRRARQYCPDLIVLDLMMPELNGWQACKEIRTFSYVPIVVFSARDEPQTIASILDAGADKFIIKPVSVNTFVAHIKSAVSRMI